MATSSNNYGKVQGKRGKVAGASTQTATLPATPRKPWTKAQMDAMALTTPADIAPMLQTRTAAMRVLLTAPERAESDE